MNEHEDDEWLRANGFARAARIGAGGEARVYRVSDDEILRLARPGATRGDAERRIALSKAIADGATPCSFRTPEIVSLIASGDRVATIERLIPGRALDDALAGANDRERERMIAGWLDAALEVSTIEIEADGYGDPLGPPEARYPDFHPYWERRLKASLASRSDLYRGVDAAGIARALPAPDAPRLVHLDLFGGNLLWHEGRVSGVLDFGYSTMLGDGRLTCLFAAVFALSSPRASDAGDERHVRSWLASRELEPLLPAAERMVAAYWSFVDDDAPLDAWCRGVLLDSGGITQVNAAGS